MASQARRPPDGVGPAGPTPLPPALLRAGHRYAFFQAVRILERSLGGRVGEGGEPAAEPVRVRPHAGLAFPTADVRSVRVADERATVTVTFLGLYGVDAPLPVFFHQDVALHDGEPHALRDFLDLFHDRLYGLLYRAWKKHRPHLAGPDAGSEAGAGRIFERLAGLGTAGTVRPGGGPLGGLLAHAGLLATRTRNAAGLARIVSDAFGGWPAAVVENVARWVPLGDRPRLGRGGVAATLGDTAVAGGRVLDRAGLFRLVLGPLPFHRYRALLPSGPDAPLLDGLVRLYAPDHLDYDVELRVRPADAPPARLGRGRRLGHDLWVGRRLPAEHGRVVRYAPPVAAVAPGPAAPSPL